MLTHAITALRQTIPEAEITWAIGETAAPVIAGQGLIDRIVIADRAAWKAKRLSVRSVSEQMRVFRSLRQYKFDYGFDFQGHFKTALCLASSGAKSRYASRSTDRISGILNDVVSVGAGEVHEIVSARNLLEAALGPLQTTTLPCMPRIESTRQLDRVVIQVGTGHPNKTVPFSTWDQVASKLCESGQKVTMIGGAEYTVPDQPYYENLVGKLTLSETMEMVASSGLHLSGDTGTAHIAAAYGVPCVTVFGFMSSVKYRPIGSSVRVIEGGNDLSAVTPDEILESAGRLMRGRIYAS